MPINAGNTGTPSPSLQACVISCEMCGVPGPTVIHFEYGHANKVVSSGPSLPLRSGVVHGYMPSIQ